MELKAGLKDLNERGGVYLPKWLVDFIGSLFCSPTALEGDYL